MSIAGQHVRLKITCVASSLSTSQAPATLGPWGAHGALLFSLFPEVQGACFLLPGPGDRSLPSTEGRKQPRAHCLLARDTEALDAQSPSWHQSRLCSAVCITALGTWEVTPERRRPPHSAAQFRLRPSTTHRDPVLIPCAAPSMALPPCSRPRGGPARLPGGVTHPASLGRRPAAVLQERPSKTLARPSESCTDRPSHAAAARRALCPCSRSPAFLGQLLLL